MHNLDKLMTAFDEVSEENTFLSAKARYYQQTCEAKDISLRLARQELVELRSEIRTLKAASA